MYILGINAYHADASATIIKDGDLITAVEEERFNRIKHSAGFPYLAVRYCMDRAGIEPQDIDHIAISRNPYAHAQKKILFAISRAHRYNLLRDQLTQATKIRDVKGEVAKALDIDVKRLRAKLHHVEHHRAHAASSAFVSKFEKAAFLSVDGFGDCLSTMWGIYEGNKINILGWVEFPHSLGHMYMAFTQYLGFPKYGDEYKVMGLSSYGEPSYLDEFRSIVYMDSGMKFKLNLSYFVHHNEGIFMTWEEGAPFYTNGYSNEVVKRFGEPRDPMSEIEKHHKDIAMSLQTVLEETIFHILNKLYEKTRIKKLCMAGGVALNCAANGKIFEKTPFEEVFIQPAAYDGGTSLGSVYYVYHQVLQKPRNFAMDHVYWGPAYTNQEIMTVLDQYNLKYRFYESEELIKKTALALAEGKVVGWFQGRMEFGPRALGNRSIVVDPRRKEMKDILNRRIKHREPFRPFAPSILEEATGEYFETANPSPYMLMTYKVKANKRDLIPAVTHVDGTGRLQTVSKESNSLYWRLIKEYERHSGVPLVLNTSFNENEPIVCSPKESIDCFLRTKMDVLVMENYFLEKQKE